MASVIERYTLDMLTPNSVSIKKQQHVEINGVEYPIGEPWRRAYVNSPSGRQEVQDEVPEPYRSAIFAVWGDEPIVPDPIEPIPEQDAGPENEEGEGAAE
jgi:hypothetical protein